MTMDTNEIFRFYEIKISKSDFYSKSDHTFLGHFNYYVMPNELYEIVKQDIPKHIGVHNGEHLIKRPVKQSLQINQEDLKKYMIRSLSRDVKKLIDGEKPTKVQELTRKLQDETRMSKYYKTQLNKIEEKLYIIENPPKYDEGDIVFVEPCYEGDKMRGIGEIQGYNSYGYVVFYESGKEERCVAENRIKRVSQ